MEKTNEIQLSYDRIVQEYLESRTVNKGISGFFNREIEQPTMLKLIPKDLSGKNVLDLGCGPGIHLKKVIERGGTGCGIDISPKMIEVAKEHCKGAKLKVGDIKNLNYEDNSFDIVFSSYVLDHIEDLVPVIKEIKRVLKEKGQFICSIDHPIRFMFRGSEKNSFVPSHSYFDNEITHYNMAGSNSKIPGFPKTMQEYILPFIEQGFTLKGFIENVPEDSWKLNYPDIDKNVFKIPSVCFFKWEKQNTIKSEE
jgi:ubiquinone/menaquinone biosynthesis C-methylase UbiE